MILLHRKNTSKSISNIAILHFAFIQVEREISGIPFRDFKMISFVNKTLVNNISLRSTVCDIKITVIRHSSDLCMKEPETGKKSLYTNRIYHWLLMQSEKSQPEGHYLYIISFFFSFTINP